MTAPARCKSCKAPILWARTVRGRAIPLDQITADAIMANLRETDDGRYEVVPAGSGTHVSHFASCPDAPAHRKGRAA